MKRMVNFICVFVLLLYSVGSVKALNVQTIGSNAFVGFNDGGQAVAKINAPHAITVAGDEIYFIGNNNRVRVITKDGHTYTLAGGDRGYLDGKSNRAKFNSPKGIAINSQGDIYIADTENHKIRKIDSSISQVITVAGSSRGFADGANAQFNRPMAIAFDAQDNLYIADAGNHKIRMLDANGFVSTVAGGRAGYIDGANARFNYPTGLALDNSGNIFVTDYHNNRIRKIDSSGTVSTLAGSSKGYADGQGSSAQFHAPIAITILNEVLYVSDRNNHYIRRVDMAGNVSTLAGRGRVSFADGGAEEAGFAYPRAITNDGEDIIVADTHNHTIRRIDLDGTYVLPEVSTYAGRTSNGKEDGPRQEARISYPRGIVQDSKGNVIFADSNNHRIRKIDTSGNVTTLAGSSRGFADGAGSAAKFNLPHYLAIDANDNVYVADTYNHKIRKLDTSGNVTTLAGSSRGFTDGASVVAKFNYPRGLHYDSASNILYVADTNNNRIRSIDSAGNVSTFAGSGHRGVTDGEVHLARFNAPYDLAESSDGSFYVVDQGNNAIRKIYFESGHWIVHTVAGALGVGYSDGHGLETQFNRPTSLAIDSADNIYVVDRGNHRIRRINAQYDVTTFAGSGVNGFKDDSAEEAAFHWPETICILNDGNILVGDTRAYRIRKLTTENITPQPLPDDSHLDHFYKVETFVGNHRAYKDGPDSVAAFSFPAGIAFDKSGNLILADRANHRIRKIDLSGFVTTIAGSPRRDANDGFAFTAGFNNPYDVVVDSQGNIFVADFNNHKVRKFDALTKQVSTFAGSTEGNADGTGTTAQFKYPIALAIDNEDNIYVAEHGNSKIRKITPNGVVTTFAGTSRGYRDGNVLEARFNRPRGMVFDAVGNLYVADTGNHRIRKISPDGQVKTLAGGGSGTYKDGYGKNARFYSPTDLAFDLEGHLLVADYNNHRIRKIDEDGYVSTIVGNGVRGFKDANGLQASFAHPISLVVAPDGAIYVSGQNNHRIRKITKASKSVPVVVKPEDPNSGNDSNAGFQFRNSPPLLSLINDLDLKNGEILEVTEGKDFNIKLFAFDYEDGSAIESQVQWRSSLQGQLPGEGLLFNTKDLLIGRHALTASVIDSHGSSSVLVINVIVNEIPDEDDDSSGLNPNTGDLTGVSSIYFINPNESKKHLKRFRKKGKLRAIAWHIGSEENAVPDNISEQIIWSSDRDGDFGIGPRVNLSSLSIGEHTITLAVDDASSSFDIKVVRKGNKFRFLLK